MQPCKTGDQPYSDASPLQWVFSASPYGEYSLHDQKSVFTQSVAMGMQQKNLHLYSKLKLNSLEFLLRG